MDEHEIGACEKSTVNIFTFTVSTFGELPLLNRQILKLSLVDEVVAYFISGRTVDPQKYQKFEC